MALLRLPAFKTYLRPVSIPGKGVLLLSEDGANALHGTLYEKIGRSSTAVRTVDDIVDALAGEATLAAASVRVTVAGPVDGEPIKAALQSLGIILTDDGAASSLDLVLTDDCLRDELEAINTAAQAGGRRWMLVRPMGFEM